MLYDAKGKLFRHSGSEWLQVQSHHSHFTLLQSFRSQDPEEDVAPIVEPELETEVGLGLCGDVLVGEAGGGIAFLGRGAVLAGQLSGADLVDEVVLFGVVAAENLGELLVLLNHLQDEHGIRFEGRIGVHEQLIDHEVEVALPVGLQYCRVVSLVAVVIHGGVVGALLDPADGSLVECLGARCAGVTGVGAGGLFVVLPHSMLEEAFDAVVDFAEVLVAVFELN